MLSGAKEDRMRDFELERHGHVASRRDATTVTPATGVQGGVPSVSPALDAAAVMHLQRAAGNASVVQLLAADQERSPVHDVVGSGGGEPLDASTRAGMESAFGTSFGDVRVHTDDRASKSAEAVGANAYTVGSDVVFRSGQYSPSTPTGQRTLAHELAHVVQQSQGPVDGTDAGGGIRLSSPSDRFEQAADATADQVMTAPVQRESVPEAEEELA
jgi:hypothetical protein